MELQDLGGAEFHRLLRLAHAEGLLDGFLRHIGFQDHREVHSGPAPSRLLGATENRSTESPLSDRRYQRTAFGWSVLAAFACLRGTGLISKLGRVLINA
jgi:hypothetical protein